MPVVRKALGKAAGSAKPSKALLDPRDDASDGFATSHKITREARTEERPARRLDDKYDRVLEEQESGPFDTPAPPQPQPAQHSAQHPGPKLLRLLGGSGTETHLPLVQLNPAILPGKLAALRASTLSASKAGVKTGVVASTGRHGASLAASTTFPRPLRRLRSSSRLPRAAPTAPCPATRFRNNAV